MAESLMNPRVRLFMALVFIGLSLFAKSSHAESTLSCNNGTSLTHVYPSGAQWAVCAALDDNVGLHLSELHYQAPGAEPRRTFSELHLGGLLEHYHNESQERSVLSELNFGGDAFVSFKAHNCPGELVALKDGSNNLCAVGYADRILAKFGSTSVLQSHRWDVIAAASDGQDVWEVSISFGEEGSITPTVKRSGVIHRFTHNLNFGSTGFENSGDGGAYAVNSTLLATWRIVPGFALEFDENDAGDGLRVEQYDFPLRTDLGNRRPMSVQTLTTETLRQLDRETFRTWVITGPSGAGYSIDVQNNGFQYRSKRYNWSLFDLALTRFKACEKVTLDNPLGNTDSACGTSLEAFINGESLQNSIPVIWFSQSIPIVPSAEDRPLMQTRTVSFDLVPFDWTDVSPFAPAPMKGDGS